MAIDPARAGEQNPAYRSTHRPDLHAVGRQEAADPVAGAGSPRAWVDRPSFLQGSRRSHDHSHVIENGVHDNELAGLQPEALAPIVPRDDVAEQLKRAALMKDEVVQVQFDEEKGWVARRVGG